MFFEGQRGTKMRNMINGRNEVAERRRKREEGKKRINEGREGAKKKDIFICLSAKQNEKRVTTMEKDMGLLGLVDSTQNKKRSSLLRVFFLLP